MVPSARSRTRLAWAIAPILVLAAASGAHAASSQEPETFDHLIAGMQLVIVAQVTGSETLGYTYSVEHVLKGSSGPTLRLPPDLQAAVEPGWTEVVIAFSDPSTDDFRAPTIAWHVAADGTIDPEGYQQYPGLPHTLDAMLAAFQTTPSSPASEAPTVAVPPTSPSSARPSVNPTTAPVPADSGPSRSSLAPVLGLVLLVLAGAVALAWRTRRR
jgi:hypothetical protein